MFQAHTRNAHTLYLVKELVEDAHLAGVIGSVVFRIIDL